MRYVLLLVFLSSCGFTHNKLTKFTALPRVVKGESILVMPIDKISKDDGFDLFEVAKVELQKTNQVQYLPLVEYDLISSGVSKEFLYTKTSTDSLKTVIAKITKCRYLLFVDIIKAKNGVHLEYSTVNNSNEFDSNANDAMLDFQLFDTKNYVTKTRFMLETTVGPVGFQNRDGKSVTTVNLVDANYAIFKSFKKGMKIIRKKVVRLQ